MGVGGVVRTLTWDNTTRAPLTLYAATGTTTHQADTYTYDPQSGRVTGIWDEVAQQRQCYEYDDFNRLAAAWTQDGARPTPETEPAACATANATTAWNAAASPSNYSSTWTYSNGGRILTASTKTNAAPDAGDTTYVYNASVPNAPTDKIPAAVSSTTGAQPGSFTYDEAGRMTQRTFGGVSQALAWDVLSNLTSITQGTTTTEYLYDASGQRFAAITSTTATIYMGSWEATDPSTGTTETTDVTVTRLYSAGGAQLASKTTGASLLVTLGDVQGSAQVTVSSTGAVTRNAYTPYGTERAGSAIVSAHGWLNQVADATGLTYLNARYYDPMLGRFLSPDPLMNPSDPRTLDPYRYADNNPVSYTDATGLAPSCAGDPTGNCEKYAKSTYNYVTAKSKVQHNQDVARSGGSSGTRTGSKTKSQTPGPLALSPGGALLSGSCNGAALDCGTFGLGLGLDAAKVPALTASQAGINLSNARWHPGKVGPSAVSQSGSILAGSRNNGTFAWWKAVGRSPWLEGAGQLAAGAGTIWATYDATQSSLDRGEEPGIAVARGSAAVASGGISFLAAVGTSAAVGTAAGTVVPGAGNVVGFVAGAIVGVGVYAVSNWMLNKSIDEITYD